MDLWRVLIFVDRVGVTGRGGDGMDGMDGTIGMGLTLTLIFFLWGCLVAAKEIYKTTIYSYCTTR